MTRFTLLFFPLALLAGLVNPSLDAEATTQPPVGKVEMHLLPFSMMENIRETGFVVPMQLQAYNAGLGAASLVRLEAWSVHGQLLDSVALKGERLLGDEGELFRIHHMLERMNPELSHRHTDRLFIPLEDREVLLPDAEAQLLSDTIEAVAVFKKGGVMQMRNLTFEVNLAELFPVNAEPGDEAVIDIRLHYLDGKGQPASLAYTHAIQLLPAYLPPPEEWQARFGMGRSTPAWYAGDLHVHNCRDQAAGGCPSCAAESFNLTGSYSNAQLKPQFQALGFGFFSTTTHSYCINNDTEFQEVVTESTQLDEATFRVLCGTELTNREKGPQQGSDINDTLCTLGGNWGRGIAHMGGHGITTRKPGGQQGFMDNCDAPIMPQDENVRKVNQEGGFTIANHPGGDTLSFNSVDRFQGMEMNMTVGTEVWNHDVSSGFITQIHRNWWIERMLEGKITYPFSGSDTHDEAVDFGATHVLVDGALTDAKLIASMKQGRHYLSNGPFLSNTLYDNGGRSLDMGGIIQVAASRIPQNYPVHLDSFYNLGNDVATVRVYRGVVGDNDETILAEYQNVTGSGVLTTNDTVQRNGTSWYRTEMEVGWGNAAYTSPCIIFLN